MDHNHHSNRAGGQGRGKSRGRRRQNRNSQNPRNSNFHKNRNNSDDDDRRFIRSPEGGGQNQNRGGFRSPRQDEFRRQDGYSPRRHSNSRSPPRSSNNFQDYRNQPRSRSNSPYNYNRQNSSSPRGVQNYETRPNRSRSPPRGVQNYHDFQNRPSPSRSPPRSPSWSSSSCSRGVQNSSNYRNRSPSFPRGVQNHQGTSNWPRTKSNSPANYRNRSSSREFRRSPSCPRGVQNSPNYRNRSPRGVQNRQGNSNENRGFQRSPSCPRGLHASRSPPRGLQTWDTCSRSPPRLAPYERRYANVEPTERISDRLMSWDSERGQSPGARSTTTTSTSAASNRRQRHDSDARDSEVFTTSSNHRQDDASSSANFTTTSGFVDDEPLPKPKHFANPSKEWLAFLKAEDAKVVYDDDVEGLVEEIRAALAAADQPRRRGGRHQTRGGRGGWRFGVQGNPRLQDEIRRRGFGGGGAVAGEEERRTTEEWRQQQEDSSLITSPNWMAVADFPTTHEPPFHRDMNDPPCRLFSKLTRRIVDKDYSNRSLRNSCIYCGGWHKPDECPTIVSVSERRERLLDIGHCTRCIRRHPVAECDRLEGFPCGYCMDQNPTGDLHHASICTEAVVPKEVEQEEEEEW